jgi:uncharacterized membrane protein (TIGR02234 family)
MTTADATPDTGPLARSRRLRLLTILAIAAVAGLTLLATTQTWWTIHLSDRSIPVHGTVAAQALSALSLTELALAAALAISGPVFRLILGLLQLLVAFTVVTTSIFSLTNPEQPSESLISQATGVAGTTAISRLIQSVSYTAWGGFAIAFGVLAFLVGVWLLATFRRWPTASRRYSAVRFAPADGPRDSVIDWDALSEGDDPTMDR